MPWFPNELQAAVQSRQAARVLISNFLTGQPQQRHVEVMRPNLYRAGLFRDFCPKLSEKGRDITENPADKVGLFIGIGVEL